MITRASRFIAAVTVAGLFVPSAGATLVSHWKFDETAGQTAADSAGTSPGTLGFSGGVDASDPAVNQPGVFGTAFDFNLAENDRVAIGNFAPFASMSVGSITGWFNSTNTLRGPFVSYRETSTNDRLTFEMATSGQLHFYLEEGGAVLTHFRTTDAFRDGQWHHFALVQGGAGLTLYVDGVEVTDYALKIDSGAWFDDVTAVNAMTIGFENRLQGNYPYGGLLDDFAVFDHALDAGQLSNVIGLGAENYNVPEPGTLALAALGGLCLIRRRR